MDDQQNGNTQPEGQQNENPHDQVTLEEPKDQETTEQTPNQPEDNNSENADQKAAQ